MNEFETKLIVRLTGKIPDKELKTVLSELQILQADYDISRKKNELVRASDAMPPCYKAFIVSKRVEGKSLETLKMYRYTLDDFLIRINKPIEEVNANDIRGYLYEYQTRTGVTNCTADGRRRVLSSFFGWIHREGYIPTNPCSNINVIKTDSKPRKPLSDIQLETIREACRTKREKAIIEVLYSTGCRVSELVRLSKSDIDMATGEAQLLGKGGKYRTAYLSARAIVALEKYFETRIDDDDAVFVSERQPFHRLKKETYEQIVKRIGERSGIDRRVHPHLFRHTMATDFLERSGNVAELKSILGHSKIETSMIYADINQNSVRADHRRYIV